MSYINTNLLTNVVTTYDQTKTTIVGRVSQKTIGGEQVLGPAVPNWADVVTDAGFAPGIITVSRNIVSDVARVFVTSLPAAAGVAVSIALYNYNMKTGSMSYVGKIITPVLPNSASSTHTLRGLDIIDTGTTGWKIFLATTATVTINGGLFLLNNIALSDFTPLGTTIILPTGNDQKAMYMLQDNVNIGVNQQNIASVGLIIDSNKVYVHNGVSAAHQYHVFDAVAAPTYVENSIAITNANPGVVTLVNHGYLNNDPLFFKTSGSVSGLNTATVYFARNVTANTFELSATTGGASISTVGTQSGTHTIGRAYGTTGSNFLYKTANLPALIGTLLAVNYENPATPTDPSYGALVGQSCIALATTSNLYMGKLSDLAPISISGGTVTSGSTTVTGVSTTLLAAGMPVYGTGIAPLSTIALILSPTSFLLSIAATASGSPTLTFGQNLWPSLATANVLGSVNEVVAPTVAAAQYSSVLDCFVFISNTSFYYGKRLVNNNYLFKGGRLNTAYYEATTPVYGSIVFGVSSLQGMSLANGVAYLLGVTAGQRGVISCDLRNDVLFDQDYIVTKVINAPDSILKHILPIDKLYDYSNVVNVFYRTSGFGTVTGGWTALSNSAELNIPIGTDIQFKIAFSSVGFLSQTPPQLGHFDIVTASTSEISSNFEYSHDDSSSGTPTRCAFRLKYAYDSGVIPSTLTFRARDLSGSLLVDHDITTDAANFEYSTNNGSSWSSLGTIPNTVGTLVRYNFTSPPGVDVRVTLQDT